MRLYDSKLWQVLRREQLSRYPLCAYCEAQGITQAASIVDHITPHRSNITLFSDPLNLQSLCKHCHDSHKQRLEKSSKAIGCSVYGEPIKPHDKWI